MKRKPSIFGPMYPAVNRQACRGLEMMDTTNELTAAGVDDSVDIQLHSPGHQCFHADGVFADDPTLPDNSTAAMQTTRMEH